MKQEIFNEYLETRYNPEMKWYDDKAVIYKKYYMYFQWNAIIISALVPFFVAFIPERIKWITALVAAILAIITTALKTFKFQENWLNYRTIAETLKKEDSYYKAQIQDYADSKDREALFIERVEALISKENSIFFKIHSKNKETENKEKNKNENC